MSVGLYLIYTVLQIVLNTYVTWQFPRLLRRVGLVVRLGIWRCEFVSQRRRTINAWLPETPFMDELCTVAYTPAGCSLLPGSLWGMHGLQTAYMDLKIALPNLIFPPAVPLSSPCVNQWTWMKLAVCLLWFSTNLRNIKFIYCLILDGTTELDC